MNWKIILIFLLTIEVVKAQENSKAIALSSISPNSNYEDLKLLDDCFNGVTIVGMGESTHGTHEFFTMRHRMFKYLVEHHRFNTFFLEADYANCLRINSYIHGKIDNIENIVDGIGLWPWITTEMVDLITWMREYNTKNSTNQINFIGVDMQQHKSTIKKIHHLTNKYNLTLESTIEDADFMLVKKKELAGLKKKINYYQNLKLEKINTEDKIEYNLLIRHLSQMLEQKYNEKDYFLRDKKMGENIIYHLNIDPKIKGFLWGHNGHICKWVKSKNKKSKNWVGRTGGYLNNAIGKKYFSIGQDFDEGSFNAYYLDSDSHDTLEERRYTLGNISTPLSHNGSFAAIYRGGHVPLFIESHNFRSKYKKNEKYFIMHHIGALYTHRKQKKDKIQWGLYNYHKLNSYDAIILIKKSTPTHLLKIKSQ